MTIKHFSLLCGCNPQTLRYYDQIGLLKPVRVDQWSGYRYYDEDQALVFVKIKNLQAAGCSIEEIRELLDQDNLAIFRALDAKVAAQEKKLQEIKAIRSSYLAEMTKIEKKIQEAKEKIMQVMEQYDPAEEFGIDAEQYAGIVGNVNDCFEQTALGDIDPHLDFDAFLEGDSVPEEKEFLNLLDNPAYETVYENHTWQNVRDFLEECSVLESGKEYALLFRISKEKESAGMAFANTVLGILLEKNQQKNISLSCNVENSADNTNHFWLLRKKV